MPLADRGRLTLQIGSLSIAYVAMRCRTGLELIIIFWLTLSASGQTIDVKGGKRSPTPSPSAQATISPAPPSDAAEFRPILLGQGANSLVNRIDAPSLAKNGQKDGLVMFNC